MPAWSDAERWQALCDGTACPICMSGEPREEFVRDARRVSRALADVTGAVKLNYEIHGNTLPHLHMHIYPRYPGDRFEGGPIDPRIIVPPVYAPGEFSALRRALAQALAS